MLSKVWDLLFRGTITMHKKQWFPYTQLEILERGTRVVPENNPTSPSGDVASRTTCYFYFCWLVLAWHRLGDLISHLPPSLSIYVPHFLFFLNECRSIKRAQVLGRFDRVSLKQQKICFIVNNQPNLFVHHQQ